MLGSLPLFSSVVPACGFRIQLRSKSQEVDESRSRRIESQARSSGRRMEHRWPPLDQCKVGRIANRLYAGSTEFREQSENVYENKGRGQKCQAAGKSSTMAFLCWTPGDTDALYIPEGDS
jgi:hypothetical protein